MKVEKQIFLYNLTALICAIWFLLAGWVWTYLVNLFIAYPIGLLGLYFWFKGKADEQKNTLNRVVLLILVSGILVSIVTFFLYYFDVW